MLASAQDSLPGASVAMNLAALLPRDVESVLQFWANRSTRQPSMRCLLGPFRAIRTQ